MREKLIQDGGDEEYHLIDDDLIRFKRIIYVPNSDELNRIIMKKFHVKPYLGLPRSQKALKNIKKFYYCKN